MEKEISASTFINLWKRFCDENFIKKNHPCLHQQHQSRTEQIIGEKRTTKNRDSSLGDYIKRYYKGLNYIKEDCLFDLSVYYKDEFKNVLDYKVDGEAKEIQTLSNTTNAILVEHENEVLLTYQEMIKLTYVKAKLKVIITYDRWNDIAFANTRLGSNFKEIIFQANSKLIEPTGTEYLLIIGDANETRITWDEKRFVYFSVREVCG